MVERLPLSVIILARNEAVILPNTIAALRFANDIIVVDSGSTDDTKIVAEKAGARVVEELWPGDFSVLRNQADLHANYDWILHIDADEVVTPELAEEIKRFFSDGLADQYLAARFPRKEKMFGKCIMHGGWYPQYKLRLYRKGSGIWEGRVHEAFKSSGEIYTFSSPIVHDSYKDIATFISKFNSYSSLDALDAFNKGKKFSFVKTFFQPFERFIGRYFIHRGYRDGFHGFVIAAMIGFNYLLRNLKLWEHWYRSRSDRRG